MSRKVSDVTERPGKVKYAICPFDLTTKKWLILVKKKKAASLEHCGENKIIVDSFVEMNGPFLSLPSQPGAADRRPQLTHL